MIQESSDFDFSKISEEATRFEVILDNLTQNNRIPNLNLCTIFVDGRTGKTNAQVENIKNFWTAYFQKSGGNLISYDYDCRKEIENFMQSRLNQNN
jgi:hypothetical protein